MGKRIAIVGSRDFADLRIVEKFVGCLPDDAIVISGGARGVDHIAASTARRLGFTVLEYLAAWSAGSFAGYLRNQTIVDECDQLYAFTDGGTPGTDDVIERAARAGKLAAVFSSSGEILQPVQLPLVAKNDG